MAERTILHIDMDAFFASVEQRDDPKLRNRPIAVTGSGKRTVLVSPSYEARAFGVKTGMTRTQARLLCPEIILVRAETQKYTHACNQIIKIVYGFSPDIEVFSIDEFFVDITHTMHLFGAPDEIAGRIQEDVSKRLGLSCSIGIAHNKLLAKLASERRKPCGIYWIRSNKVSSVLDGLKPDVLCGIGAKTKQALEQMGISSLGQLRNYNVAFLRRKFGVNGIKLHFMARGIDDSSVIPMGTEEEAKSMGHSMTLVKDISDMDSLSRHLLSLSDRVGRRLRNAGLSAKTVRLTIRYKSFATFTRQKTLEAHTDDTKALYAAVLSILKAIRLKEPVRLIGVSTAKLVTSEGDMSLFEENKRKYRLNRLLDYVNERFGDSAVSFASLLNTKSHNKVISPAWRPHGTRNY